MERVTGRETTITAIRNKLKSLVRNTIETLHGSPLYLERELNKETLLFLEFEYRNRGKDPILIDVSVCKNSPEREYELTNIAVYIRQILEKELRLLNSERDREDNEIAYQKEYESITGKYAFF